MVEFVCERCSKHFFDEELPRRGEICFGCHVKSINLGFTHGKNNFHGDTIKQKQEKTIADARKNGLDPQPVGKAWF